MQRRIAAVVLPWFRVELARARSPGLERAPIAVVVSDANERSLTGGARIDDVSSEAQQYGVRPGATIASAKARCHDLRVRVLPPDAVTSALDGLAESLLALGAITSPLADRDAVVVDVTGCAHLFGGPDPERALLEAIERTVRAAGYDCHVAVASGPEIAWAIATGLRKSIVVPAKDTLRVLDRLPVDVLRFEDSTASYLRRLGILTLGRLRALPRESLASRVGEARATHVLALLNGDDATPLDRFEAPPDLFENVLLDYGTEHTEALLFLFKGLCDRVAARLQGRCAVVSRLEVVLDLDRAFVDADQRRHVISLPLASPLDKSEAMLAVLRSRFEREPPLRSPVVGVGLRAADLANKTSHSLHLFVPESRAELALPALAAELAALLGEDAAGTLAAVDDWRPFERSRLVPFGQPRPAMRLHTTARLVNDAPEPVRIFPRSLEAHDYQKLAHLARYEHVAWWRADSRTKRRDLVLAWASDAIVFVFEDGDGHAQMFGVL